MFYFTLKKKDFHKEVFFLIHSQNELASKVACRTNFTVVPFNKDYLIKDKVVPFNKNLEVEAYLEAYLEAYYMGSVASSKEIIKHREAFVACKEAFVIYRGAFTTCMETFEGP